MKKPTVTTLSVSSISFLIFAGQLAAQDPTKVVSNPPSPSAISSMPVLNTASATVAASTRATSAPVLDGKTDDPAWQNAQVIDKFLEYEPKPGAETRFKTEVRVVHDEKNLYVLARMFDPAPDSIISLLSRRDVRTHTVSRSRRAVTTPTGVS